MPMLLSPRVPHRGVRKGYFTVERNIEGATLREIESKLGFRPGRLAQGARVLVL